MMMMMMIMTLIRLCVLSRDEEAGLLGGVEANRDRGYLRPTLSLFEM